MLLLLALLGAISVDADPLEGLQWHLHNDGSRTDLWPQLLAGADIAAPTAWLVTRGDPAVVVAVLDTGFPEDHPDLPAARRVHARDFIDGDGAPTPPGIRSLDAHGTAVAALALAPENGSGITGVCPECTLLPIRVIASNDSARDGQIIEALMWAAERADVIVASWSFDTHAYVSPAVHDAIRFAAREGRGGRGCVVVFSAGNRASPIEPFVPQAMHEVLTVGATDERDVRASYSNHGAGLGVMAPGGVQDQFSDGNRIARAKLVTADLAGEAGNSPARDAVVAPGIVSDLAATASFFGTSGAAPIAGGVAALLIAARPALTANEVIWIITETATKVGGVDYAAGGGWHAQYGWGRIDAGAALAMAEAGTGCIESVEVCDDGDDDDCDRLADAADPECGGPDVRTFALPLGTACDDATDCGDGFCSPAEGALGVRFCSALCDYDCPPAGVCAGLEGSSRCHSGCAADSDCDPGFACATPDAALFARGLEPARLCAAQCTRDDQCDAALCRDGVCAGAPVAGVSPPPGTPEGCGCATSGGAPALLAALMALRRRKRGAAGGEQSRGERLSQRDVSASSAAAIGSPASVCKKASSSSSSVSERPSGSRSSSFTPESAVPPPAS